MPVPIPFVVRCDTLDRIKTGTLLDVASHGRAVLFLVAFVTKLQSSEMLSVKFPLSLTIFLRWPVVYSSFVFILYPAFTDECDDVNALALLCTRERWLINVVEEIASTPNFRSSYFLFFFPRMLRGRTWGG